MKITRDDRPEDFLRLEQLLYGNNYCVWVNVYGPLDASQSLAEALTHAVSRDSVVGGATDVSVSEVQQQVLELLLHPGDEGSGPVDLATKLDEITLLAEKLMQTAHVHEADDIKAFWFKKGHPAYPVFWEFAYDVHAQGKRWILVGSSSD